MALDLSARQRRLHRARSAHYIAALPTTCSIKEIAALDWASLESLPHWCFLPADDQRNLQLLCGAMFMAPLINQWIDGKQIQTVRGLLGIENYQNILAIYTQKSSTNASLGIPEFDSPALSIEQQLLAAGSAILIGAIAHPTIRSILTDQFPNRIAPPKREIATFLYALAVDLIDNSATEAKSAPGADSTN